MFEQPTFGFSDEATHVRTVVKKSQIGFESKFVPNLQQLLNIKLDHALLQGTVDWLGFFKSEASY